MQDSAPNKAELPAGTAAPAATPIEFHDVGFQAGAVTILEGIDLTLARGGPTIIMGPNGSGKTTLLKLAMGLIMPTTGRLSFAGHDQAASGSRALVFQKPVMLRRSVAANIEFALSAAGHDSAATEVSRLLDVAAIGPLANRPARRLSGGEQQRLALVRALARRPQVLFLDEPTASLDPAATKMVEEIITRVAASGVKIVMATHDLGQARRLAREVVFLARGRLAEHTPAEQFFTSPATEEARRFLNGDLVL
jgi:tungstate transport system ATP-binding protein